VKEDLSIPKDDLSISKGGSINPWRQIRPDNAPPDGLCTKVRQTRDTHGFAIAWLPIRAPNMWSSHLLGREEYIGREQPKCLRPRL